MSTSLADDRSPGELLRISVHEAGHGLMALEFGMGVELLSIRPGKYHGGVCIGAPAPSEVPRSQAWRRQIEYDLMILLAGHFAEVAWLYPDTESFDRTEPDLVAAERLAEQAVRVPLTRTQEETWEESERTEGLRDEERARGLAELLTPRAEAFLEWMRQETWEEVRSEKFMTRLKAVAPLLRRERVLSGATLGDVVRYADRGFPIRIAAHTNAEEETK